MDIILTAVIAAFLLMLIQMHAPGLLPFFLMIFYFLLLAQLTMRLLIPAIRTIAAAGLPAGGLVALLAGSALVFHLSESFSRMMEDAGFGPVGRISHTAAKLLILAAWSEQLLEASRTVIGLLP
ncbi:hypothetical protein ACFFIY_10765 [Bhargavaea ullalensis]|uniref:AI-2E family transporter n=1 Tax=Bhargavaea ullalensis TaxID=1265685 RepID=A0ABV2G945_9BACL